MSNNSEKSKRIAKNTIVLYFRMIFMMLVMLYASRVVLDTLGVEDYGIYNVVGGFVAMFGLISAALTSACTRFLNFEMGKGNIEKQNLVFSTSVSIQLGLAFIVFVLAEIIGVWYINNVMVLPECRIEAANWCFQFSVATFCMNLIVVPYSASIIAHERMTAYAYISIFQGVATLLVTFLIVYNPFDRLIFYALLLFIVQIIVQFLYQIYCRKYFIECRYKNVFDKTLLKKMLSYSGWHLIGNGATVLKNEGVNVVLNLFFGPAVNSARGLSMQVDSAVTQFASNFMMAMNPQITQSYASGDLNYMFNLINKGARLSYYLLLILSLPIILNAEAILGIWLKEVPEHTVLFTQLSMIAAMVCSLSRPLITAQNATGNVRNYQLVVGGILLLTLPLSYIGLLCGLQPASVLVVTVVVECACLIARIFLIPHTIHKFVPSIFFKEVLMNCFIVSLIAVPLPLIMKICLPVNLYTVFANIIISVISVSVTVLILGCDKNERQFIYSKIKSFSCKLLKK